MRCACTRYIVFFTHIYIMYHAVVGSSEFTPRKQWFISLCRRSLNFFPLFAQKNANIIPISWLIKRLNKKKNEVKFLFFCLCECIMSTRFYNTRVVMILLLLLLYHNIIWLQCVLIRGTWKKNEKKSLWKSTVEPRNVSYYILLYDTYISSYVRHIVYYYIIMYSYIIL